VIGDVTTQNAGFATLRCTDGLVVVLEAFQARGRLPSVPYVVSDALEGWYVSDGAANNVLHVLLAVSRAIRCTASIQDRPWRCVES
jgi:hypothetical protein